MENATVTTCQEGFESMLRELMEQPLAGVDAQLTMAPQGRIKDIFLNNKDRKPVMSSVLILLYRKAGIIHILFIRRPEYPGIHSGQIAFPGGRQEPGDQDHLATAVRETEEEVGIPHSKINVISHLTPLYIPPSNYLVHPFIATTHADPEFKTDPDEVANVVEIPFEKMLHPDIVKLMAPSGEFSFLEVPAYVIDDTIIWGATAMIAAEFISMVRSFGPERIINCV